MVKAGEDQPVSSLTHLGRVLQARVWYPQPRATNQIAVFVIKHREFKNRQLACRLTFPCPILLTCSRLRFLHLCPQYPTQTSQPTCRLSSSFSGFPNFLRYWAHRSSAIMDIRHRKYQISQKVKLNYNISYISIYICVIKWPMPLNSAQYTFKVQSFE